MAFFTPDSVDFGIVGPGKTSGSSVTSDIFAADARVTATITNDTSGGGFKVTRVTSYLAAMGYGTGGGDGSDLPGGKPRPGKPQKTVQLGQQVGQSNGITPLAVSKGQAIVVGVEFAAPVRSASTARQATLEVQGDTWAKPVSVPLTALVAEISINIPSISVAQGQTIKVPLTVESLAGPPTAVTLSANPDPAWPGMIFSVSPSSVQVSNGPGSATLEFGADLEAVVGSYSLAIDASAYGWFWSFPFSGTISTLILRPSPIDQKYAALDGAAGVLGSPTAPEAFCGDHIGQFRSYQHGAIYWSGSDASGAFEIHGPILTYLGGDRDPASACLTNEGLGYPTTDVSAPFLSGIFISHFQRGAIYSKPPTGTRSVYKPFFDTYANLGEAGGALGFPIAGSWQLPGATHWFQDFENGILFGPAGGPIAPPLPFTKRATDDILGQINTIIDNAVASYNQNAQKTGDYQVAMYGGPVLQDPQNPVTDYSVDAGGTTLNRQYKIRQNFFVSVPIWKDTDITLNFDLLLAIDKIGVGIENGIWAQVINPSVDIDTHGNPKISDSDIQNYRQKLMALATQSGTVIPLPDLSLGMSYLSVKVLADGTMLLFVTPSR